MHFRKQINGPDDIREKTKHFIESQTMEIKRHIRTTFVPPYQYYVIRINCNGL